MRSKEFLFPCFFLFILIDRSFYIFQYNVMGKGDKKTKKGKLHIGSFGKHRPHKKKKEAPKEEAKKG